MSFRYIDTHVHFWDRDLLPYSWLDSLPQISTPHTPETYRTETAALPPEKIVFLQCVGDIDSWRDEVNWVESLAQQEPRIAGIVATAPLDSGDHTLRILDELTRHHLVKGVRHNTQDEPLGFARSPAYVAGARAAGERDLSVDLCCYHPQLRDIRALVQACPDTRFILDHLGKPGIRDREFNEWADEITKLAQCAHVFAKLSGIVTEADWDSWDAADLSPYVEHYLRAFGPQRVIFGSDWPVVKLASEHQRWLQTARDLTANLSEAEQHQIFVSNAAHFYRLD